jgi:hypothetical protein
MMTGMAVIFRRPAVAMRLEVAPQLASWDKAGTGRLNRRSHDDERKSRSGSKSLINPARTIVCEPECLLLLRRARHEHPKRRRQCINIGFVLSVIYHLNPTA